MAASALTEDDIPGSSLAGREPASLKNEELRFWLRCRGDSLKGLKTKALLVKRVEEYINSGHDQNIVDPDRNRIYTIKKEHNEAASKDVDASVSGESQLKYPSDGWSIDLTKMPFFTRAEMNKHISKSGKNIGSNICEEWKQERKFRFTASNFGLISARKRNHESFVNSLLHPKPFSSRYTSDIYAYQLSSDCVTFKQTHFLIKPSSLCYPGVLLMDSEFISWCFRHFSIIYF